MATTLNSTPSESVLMMCIDPEWGYMPKPLVLGGMRHYCNGRIALRVPAPGEPDDEMPAGIKFGEVFAAFDAAACVHPWGDAEAVMDMSDCYTCDGRGAVSLIKCKKCKGHGQIECPHCNQDMDCPDCWGHGYENHGTRCPGCEGLKTIEQVKHRIIGPAWVSGKYDRIVMMLPTPRFQMPTESNKVVLFTFDGGSGCVMPLNRD